MFKCGELMYFGAGLEIFMLAKRMRMCYTVDIKKIEPRGLKSRRIYAKEQKMKTTFYLVRHGQSIGNLENRALGHMDLDLSELGYRQAAATFEYMKDWHIDAVYSSPLQRAWNTILPHAEHRGLTAIPMDDFREVFLGLWEGMYLPDIVHRWPYTFTELWRANFALSTPPKGEYVQDAADRVLRGLKSLAEKHPGQALLIGGHAGIFRAAVARIIGMPPERVGLEFPFPSNASVTTLTYEDGEFSLVRYSEDAHLSEVGTSRPQ